jgi:hypothetical protein
LLSLRRRLSGWGRRSLSTALAGPHSVRRNIALAIVAKRLQRGGFFTDQLMGSFQNQRLRVAFGRYFDEEERRKPHPLFDPAWYREQHPDTLAMPALLHYVMYGFAESRSPHPLVDPVLLKRNFARAEAFLSSGVHSLSRVNPFLEGRSDALLRSGLVDQFLTPYFDAEWLHKAHPEALDEWSATVTACDHGIAQHALAFWLVAGRDWGIPASPRLYLAPGQPPVSSQLRSALEAEPAGARLVRLETSPIGAADYVAYEGVRAISEDRLVLLNKVEEDGCLLGHHDELLGSMHDSAVGLKSSSYSLAGHHHLLLKALPTIDVREPAIHLLHEYSANYFHAMVEVVARFLRLQHRHSDLLRRRQLLIDDGLPFAPRALLERFAGGARLTVVPKRSTIRANALVYPRETAFVPDVYTREPFEGEQRVDQEALKLLVEETLRIVPAATAAASSTPRRVVIARQGTRRVMHGQQELIRALLAQGFEAFSPSVETPLQEQIEVFRGADVIVAPTGAALTNVLFMTPGARLICLSSRQKSLALGVWDQLAEVAGVHVRHVRLPIRYPKNTVSEMYTHHDFEVSIEPVMEALRSGLTA